MNNIHNHANCAFAGCLFAGKTMPVDSVMIDRYATGVIAINQPIVADQTPKCRNVVTVCLKYPSSRDGNCLLRPPTGIALSPVLYARWNRRAAPDFYSSRV